MAKHVAGAAAAAGAAGRMAAKQARVVFTPSGRRGSFALGTPVLEAARSLGVDVDSVCGGRGLCGRCQVTCSEGEFPKHAIHSRSQNLTPIGEVETRYSERRKLKPLVQGRRLSCQAQILGDLVIDVPPESQMHRQVVRKAAEHRDITLSLISSSNPSFARHGTYISGWSRRFLPTPGRSASTGILISRRWLAGPMPDNISCCGDPTAPAHKMISSP